jgi:hypothetical protein
MRASSALPPLAMLVAFTAPASAEGPLIERTFYGAVGKIGMETLGDRVYDDAGGEYGGWTFTGGGELRGIGLPTLNGRTGFQFRLDLTVVTPGVVIRDDKRYVETPETPRLLVLMTAEAGIGPLFDLYRGARNSLSLTPEAFVGTDRRGLAIQSQLQLSLLLVRFTLRSGSTWNGSQVLEEELRIAYTRASGFELGLMRTHGFAEDEMGRADLRAVAKGGYDQTQLNLRYTKRGRR